MNVRGLRTLIYGENIKDIPISPSDIRVMSRSVSRDLVLLIQK